MPRIHPIRRFSTALGFLTIAPWRRSSLGMRDPAAAAWFPLVGGLFGFVAYATVKGAALLHGEMRVPYLTSALIVFVWAVGSRMHCWRALGQAADGFWGSHDRARRREIMSESGIGGIGAAAITLVAILEVRSLGILIGYHELVVLLVPVMSRFSASAAAWMGAPDHTGDPDNSFAGRPSTLSVMVAAIPLSMALGGMSMGYHLRGLSVGVLGLIAAVVFPYILVRRFGGVTDDVIGASVLLTEVTIFTGMVFALLACR